jgi:hypothetical protein
LCSNIVFENYTDNVKETLEYVFNQGYDIIAVDSIAEVIEMVKDNYKTTEGAAESWFLQLQDNHKKVIIKVLITLHLLTFNKLLSKVILLVLTV